jgi:hypothetical protein
MADDEMAIPDSSGDDYSPEEASKEKSEGAITMTKRNRFTCFDIALITFFIGLILAMLLLKYREEIIVKEKKKVIVKIKVKMLSEF